MNTHTIVADMHQNMLKSHEATGGQNRAVSGIHALQYHRINTDIA